VGRARAGALIAAAVALSLGAACEQPQHNEPPAPPAPYTAEARALLGGLDVGEQLAGWTVDSAAGPGDGRIDVRVRKGDTSFVVWLVKKGSASEPAPYSTQLVDIYFGHSVPTQPGPPGDEIQAVLAQVVERVTRAETEAGATLPPGM